jgi:hypothetical protein
MMKFLKRLYGKLPIIRELRTLTYFLAALHKAEVNSFRQDLLRLPRYNDPRRLSQAEAQIFSQNGEDGIIAEIFRRIGEGDRFFVEMAAGSGLESNTANLLLQGWKGCWIEGEKSVVRGIEREFENPLRTGELKLRQAFITQENCASVLSDLSVPAEFDLLSLDIDRNTYHVWEALAPYRPRVVVIEYNAAFPPHTEWIVPYEPTRVWSNTMLFGASLKSYELLGRRLGYELVGCDFTGINAFFVRSDEDIALFAAPFTAENHYEPPRYTWAARREAHLASFSEGP